MTSATPPRPRSSLKQQRLRVRPKDIQTLDRARRLLDAPKAEIARTRTETESASEQLERRSRELKEKLRAEQLDSHQKHLELERALLEERIMKEELADAAPQEW